MPNKALPTDKSVLTEFQVVVADIYTRSNKLKGAMSVKVPESGSYTSSDFTVAHDRPTTLTSIERCIIVNSFQPFVIDITRSGQTTTGIPCQGLFVLYGALDSVKVYGVSPTPNSTNPPPARVTCIYS